MDEADSIFLNDLKLIGCQIPETISSAKDFNATVLVHCVLRCLRIWDKSREYPRSLATTRAQKVSQCTQIVAALQELGYNEKLSYHNLLYPNERDTRSLLAWLVSQVPIKEVNLNDSVSVLNQKIEDEIDYLTGSAVWTPPFCNATFSRHQNYFKLSPFASRSLYSPASPVFYPGGRRATAEQKQYFANDLPFFTSQPPKRANVTPSVLESNVRGFTDAQERDNEWNTVGISSGLNPQEWKKAKQEKILGNMAEAIRSASALYRGAGPDNLDEFLKTFATGKDEDTSFLRNQKFEKDQKEVQDNAETEEEINKRREREREEKDQQLTSAESQIVSTEQQLQVCATEILQMKAALQKEADRTTELKKKFTETKTTIDLLANAEENIAKLKQLAEERKEKLIAFAEKWEEVRAPLVDQYRSMKDSWSKREVEIQKKREEMTAMRDEMKTLRTNVQKKDARYKQLVEILKTLPKENRADYTNKILVLVGGVKKQKVEINKILMDTRNVQKEINSITDKLNRMFAEVEELIFQDAKKDPIGNETYKLTAGLHETFNTLTDTITKTGQASNAGLLLADKIDKVNSRVTSLNMKQIEEDLTQVREENSKLITKLKEAKEASKS